MHKKLHAKVYCTKYMNTSPLPMNSRQQNYNFGVVVRKIQLRGIISVDALCKVGISKQKHISKVITQLEIITISMAACPIMGESFFDF